MQMYISFFLTRILYNLTKRVERLKCKHEWGINDVSGRKLDDETKKNISNAIMKTEYESIVAKKKEDIVKDAV